MYQLVLLLVDRLLLDGGKMTQALLDQRITNILFARDLGAIFSGSDGSALQDGFKNFDYIDNGLSSGINLGTYGQVSLTSSSGGSLISQMSAYTSAGQIASASSNGNQSFGGAAWRAFNKSLTTGWIGTSTSSEWIKIDLGSSKEIGAYQITNAPDGVGSPTGWTLQGSDDNSTWETVDTQTSLTWSNGETKSFNITPTTYRYWILTVSGVVSGSDIRIAEIDFLPDTSVSAVIVSSGIVAESAPSTVYFSGLFANYDISKITVSLSRDGGTSYTTATIDADYDLRLNGWTVLQASAYVSGQPSGTELRYKIQVGDASISLHGASLWCDA